MVADTTAIVGKVSYDLSLKRRELIKSSLKPEFRSLRSANYEPTELLFGEDLANSRKGKYNFHQSHRKHKKSTSPVKGPTSPVRENISPVREQRYCLGTI